LYYRYRKVSKVFITVTLEFFPRSIAQLSKQYVILKLYIVTSFTNLKKVEFMLFVKILKILVWISRSHSAGQSCMKIKRIMAFLRVRTVPYVILVKKL